MTTYVKWGRPRNSWHILVGTRLTVCGRLAWFPYETRDALPAARSCETCLRLDRRRGDR